MTDVSRVVLITPHRTVEMALPSTVPLADLIPVLVQRATMSGMLDSAGRNRAFTGDGDWVLQRLGTGPLDEEMTPAALQIRDGETLYLNPRDAALPPVHFDDLIDGIASGVRHRPDRWRDGMTRALFLVVAAFVLVTAYVIVLRSPVESRLTIAAAGAVALAFGAMMCSRALGDGWAAMTLGVAAIPWAAMAGYAVLPPGESTDPQWLCATVSASAIALMLTFALGHHRALFLAVWLVTLAVAAGALLVIGGLTVGQAAASAVAGALVATAFAPSVAFRLALMRLPQLPTSAADLSEDIEPYAGPKLISGAVVADTYLTWMLVASGVVCLGGLAVLAEEPGWATTWFVVAVMGVLAIRSRGLGSGWQRAATVVPVLVGGSLLLIRLADGRGGPATAMTVLVLFGLVVASVGLARSLPGKRLLPYWGRIADIVEYLFALAMILLLLAVFDAYQWARALAG
ncbi:type VII secretion integral membrane protein EccD [Allocatelliglobosispora scoriae]|uniref:Type VII secretion integral membrane protein EccD n=1 Tax=Allocatelliglobosispora scoriae TaxID=643052 RepID=A0A841C5G7_9ACTN|nr:type VII secretion integral membrane protein EccD [Allocatelliglobosispora scoriae]MBB5874190.1 type VII secretion integral membrane protein EccD [Allocatelliglobosispora scoriae]